MIGRTAGIDFGTSNSGVALYDGQKVNLLPLDPQSPIPEVIKTILYITRDYKTYIGQAAVEMYYKQNVNRIRRYVKKWVGEIEFHGGELDYVRDVYVYVDELNPGRLLQYIKTALRSDTYQGTQIFDRYYTLGDLVTTYLLSLKMRAEKVINESITCATLGRPVKFSENPEQDQRSEDILRQAAYEAGFQEVNFEYEPVAAALFYEQSLSRPENVLIFDFGGGTLDITIMRLGDPKNRAVLANGGISIAGSDFDRAIIEKRMLPHFGHRKIFANPDLLELINAVSDWAALPELSTPQARVKLEKAIIEKKAPVQLKALESLIFNDLAFSFYNAIESAKISLSSQGTVVIRMEEKDIDIWELYTRYQFEKDIREHVKQIEGVLLDTIIASGLEPEQIDAVVKTGGSSHIPIFHQMLSRVFGVEKVKVSDTFSSVTSGLAIKAYQSMALSA